MGMAATSARALAGLLASAALAAAPLTVAPRSEPGPELRFAVLPCTNIETSFGKFHPLLAYLKSSTGFKVTLVVPADLADTTGMVCAWQSEFGRCGARTG